MACLSSLSVDLRVYLSTAVSTLPQAASRSRQVRNSLPDVGPRIDVSKGDRSCAADCLVCLGMVVFLKEVIGEHFRASAHANPIKGGVCETGRDHRVARGHNRRIDQGEEAWWETVMILARWLHPDALDDKRPFTLRAPRAFDLGSAARVSGADASHCERKGGRRVSNSAVL